MKINGFWGQKNTTFLNRMKLWFAHHVLQVLNYQSSEKKGSQRFDRSSTLSQGEYFNRGNQLHFIQTLLQELLSHGTSNLIFSLSEQNCVRLVGSGLMRKNSRFWLFCMWSGKWMFHALIPTKHIKRIQGGHGCRLFISNHHYWWCDFVYYFVSMTTLFRGGSSRTTVP